VAAATGITDSKEFLEAVVRGEITPNELQMEAARSLLPFQHRKLGEAGKKEQRKDDAGQVVKRFAPASAPRLHLVQPRSGTKGNGGSDER
jgi:phage terminase small subunit